MSESKRCPVTLVTSLSGGLEQESAANAEEPLLPSGRTQEAASAQTGDMVIYGLSN